MKRTNFIFAAIAAAAFTAAADEPLAVSGESTFSVNLQDASPFALADFLDMPVTWRKGESVRAISPHGASSAYATDASVDGASAIGTLSGGVWTLVNDGMSSVKVLVPWSVYGDGASFSVAGADSATLALDTIEDGPDRTMRKKDPVIPVSYSDDDWGAIETGATAATVVFTPPAGSSLAATTWSDFSAGAREFTFNEKGVWTVMITFIDGTTQTAEINVQNAGFMIIVK